VQLTAVVSNTSGSNIPTGLVEFLNGTTSLGTATLDATGTATLITTTLPVGSDLLTAEYEGDLQNAISTSSVLTQIVSYRYPTTTVLSSGLNPSYNGEPVQLTAVVSNTSGSNTPTGLVEFLSGSTSLGTGKLDATGTATLTTTTLPVGSDLLPAEYEGDLQNAISTSSVLQIVNPATLVSISVMPSRASIAIGQTLQYVAIGTFSDGSQSPLPFVTGSAAPAGVVTINPSTRLATAVAPGTGNIGATFGAMRNTPGILTVGLASRYLVQVEVSGNGVEQFAVDAIVPGTGQLRAHGLAPALENPGGTAAVQVLPNRKNVILANYQKAGGIIEGTDIASYSLNPAGQLAQTGTDVSNQYWIPPGTVRRSTGAFPVRRLPGVWVYYLHQSDLDYPARFLAKPRNPRCGAKWSD
jgi:hypothetical protein